MKLRTSMLLRLPSNSEPAFGLVAHTAEPQGPTPNSVNRVPMSADAPKTLNFGVEETACGNRIESSNLSRSASPSATNTL
jgi:hypothetical protein